MDESRETAWHVMPVREVAAALGTDPECGLSAEEAARRLAEHGQNLLAPPVKVPAWKKFLAQFNDFMIWVLMAAVVISAIEHQLLEAFAITAILLLNGFLGFIQEYRAEQALEALKQMAAPTATVVRDGVEQEVPAAELVPGDVVILEAGDKVPADGRLIEAASLKVDESSLTGESRPVSKHADAECELHCALGDRSTMVYAGTTVAVGRGRFIVTETGQATEMGRIADLLAQQEEEATPLQRELKGVGKRIATLILAIATIVFAVGAWQAYNASGETSLFAALAHEAFRARLTVALLVAISLAVAAIPEGLPAIVTVALSLGVRKMAEHNAIVRKLHAVETLGSTTFICSDKTGTITRNEMAVRRVVVGLDGADILPDWALQPDDLTPDPAGLDLLLEIAASCNDAHFTADGTLVGDPTETALVVAADALAESRRRPRRVAEIPFDSERKRMTTVHVVDGRPVAYVKGGADVVLGLCTHALVRGKRVALDETMRHRILAINTELAASGFRTLAIAFRELDDATVDEPSAVERDLTYVGIVGLVDPPRPEAAEAIATCRRAGIEVAMVTGDHALTARAIAQQVGLSDDGEVLTGVEIERMSDDELYEAVARTRLYARVDPAHKLRIVEALKRHGHIVAMTGDGVNDAPALKRADIGVAMGRVGTDVSREAADMVLADDNFATIVEAVRMGRAVYDNLKKFILFLLSCNVSEVLIIFVTTFFADRPALLPLQILWINLITDGFPALALGVDPASPRVMERPPRDASESVLARKRQAQVLWQGALITVAGLIMYVWADLFMPGHSFERAQTMLFSAMVLAQLVHAFSFRSESRSIFSAYSLKNRWLNVAFAGSLLLQLGVVYLPPLQRVFKTQPLSVSDWLAVIAAAIVPTVLIDITKRLVARSSARSAPTEPVSA
ncbi:calcium-translocating P-type ATPase, PMCA-type [Coriobacteriia bacterium Es71-Z0120]|uniref:calcium-translocating P-type ATPase, PMCA-type n=1 Tax=Parvivirga hydrogeniphila TaxID=2939460 RepID=UPI00226096CA|nr:calcium-translocating P-type ATPase, PMCA-type [Parvivirga hydrogeniphila]MCL4078170.1 calcium-translocating P-type ATPase, PMCA-type [Parvivirga hydrogeniphila]